VHEIDTREVIACDGSFSTALLAADHDLLGAILADDLVIIDVLSGQVARRKTSRRDQRQAAAVRRGDAGCRGTFGLPSRFGPVVTRRTRMVLRQHLPELGSVRARSSFSPDDSTACPRS
jgi:hypothetical protein